MVGLLVRIGAHEEVIEAVSQALQCTKDFDRRRAPEAPAEGLWLESVDFAKMVGRDTTHARSVCSPMASAE